MSIKTKKRRANQIIFYQERAMQGDLEAQMKLEKLIAKEKQDQIKEEQAALLTTFKLSFSNAYDADVIEKLNEMKKNRLLESYLRGLIRADIEKAK